MTKISYLKNIMIIMFLIMSNVKLTYVLYAMIIKINYIDLLPKKEELIQKKDELKNIITAFPIYPDSFFNI